MKVLLISEHLLQQNLLRIALEKMTGVEIVGKHLEARAALRHLAETEAGDKPDLVILGMQLPDMDGLALMTPLRRSAPSARILVVTTQPEERYLPPFLLLGGNGYLSSYASDEAFCRAVDAVMNGRIFLTQEGIRVLEDTCGRLTQIREAVTSQQAKPQAPDAPPFPERHLSAREKQVLHLYVNGYRSSEIGSILFMSPNTIETHKKRIKEKLNLTRKADLTAYAKQNGLFEDWD